MQKIGSRLKSIRLKHNMTQQELSNQSMVSVSTIKKIEDGQINSFDSLLRLMRILGKLDLLQELTKEEKLSPNEYYAMVNSVKKHQRKRARSSKKKMWRIRNGICGEVVLRAHYRTGSRFAILRTALKRLSSSMRISSSLKSSSSMRSSTSMNKTKEPRLIFINRGSRSVATTYSSTW